MEKKIVNHLKRISDISVSRFLKQISISLVLSIHSVKIAHIKKKFHCI